MRLRYACPVVLLVTLLIAPPALAQWLPIGPAQTEVTGYAADGTLRYMATTEGIFSRDADADRWTDLSDGLPEPRIETMALADGTLYVHLGASGLWRRDGDAWTERSNAAGGTALTAQGSTLFVVHDDAVWTSTDGGATWAPTAAQPDPGNVNNEPVTLAVAGDHLLAGMTLGVWRSADGGATWAKADVEANNYVTVDRTTGTAYAVRSTGGSRLARSTDGGATWTVGYAAPLGKVISHVAARGDTVVVVHNSSEVVRSTDGGATFAPIVPPFATAFGARYPNAPVYLATDADGFYLNYSLGIYRSDDGETWAGFSEGLTATNDVLQFVHHKGRLLALTGDFAVHAAMESTTEFAPNCWKHPDSGLQSCLPAATGIGATDGHLFYNYQLLYRSNDGGATYRDVPGVPGSQAGLQLVGDGAQLYALTANGVYKTDGDADAIVWTQVLSEAFGNSGAQRGKLTVDGDVVIASGPNNTHLSTDGGATWIVDTQTRSKPGAVIEDRIWISPTRYTDDGGATFTDTTPPADESMIGVGSTLVVGGRSGVFASRDNGETWEDLTANFPAAAKPSWSAAKLFHDDDYLYASLKYNEGSGGDQGGGLWRRGLAQLDIATPTEPTAPSAEFDLDAHPSPFGHTLTATITLAETGPVRLTLFDLLGREVATLVDGVLPATRHPVRFDGSDLPAGLYLLRLDTPVGTLTRKVVRLD